MRKHFRPNHKQGGVRQRRRQPARKRAGISEALASVLLVLIVAGLGALLLSYSTSSFQLTQDTARTLSSVSSAASKERLTVEFVQFSSPSTITVYVRNTGKIDATILALYISDPTGKVLSNTPTSLALNLLQLGNVVVSFTFTSGSTYLITLATSRGSSLTSSWKV